MTVDESHNVRVLEALEDVDLQREVFFELLIEFRQVDRLDGDVGAVFLSITQNPRSANAGSRSFIEPPLDDERLTGMGPAGSEEQETETYRVHSLVDGCKAPSSDLVQPQVATYRYLGMRTPFSGPPRRRGRRMWSGHGRGVRLSRDARR
jgi:hypothetical protein